MALEDIIKKISEDDRSEAESVLSRARAEADAMREKARKQADELRSEMMRKAQERAEEQGNRIEVLAGLEQRKDVLREKKTLIEVAFAKAEERIKSLPPDEYLAFLRPLILGAVESGNEEIIPSKTHTRLFTPELVKSLNDELGPGKGHLRLSGESGEFPGGFILREGKKETNLTLESLIKSQRDNLEPSVAGILFGETKGSG